MTMPPVGIPVSQTNISTVVRRRGPLRSRAVDTFLHILSLCYVDSSHIIHDSDKGTKDDAPVVSTNVLLNDSLCQKEKSTDETRVVSATQEGDLYYKQVKSTECDRNRSGEMKDTYPSNSFSTKNQDNYDITGDRQNGPMTPISVTDTMISSQNITTNKDVEEGEISGELMDFMPEDDASSVDKTGYESENFLGIEPGLENVGEDRAMLSKTKRNLVDYSEIALRGRLESRNSDCVPPRPENAPPVPSILKNSVTKNQDFASMDTGVQNNKKRQASPTEEKLINKKSKTFVDPIACPENLTMLGQRSEDASQEGVDASANKDDANEKKKKRVLTKERKAKKKKKDRIKRAEKNRKLGVKRLKLEPVIKEKKITYCRHYMKGRCHEGEKCNFSHDTIPLTKSKPCCHFARHACMKGDDCPFDHQLSKYPCNNILSKGFCSRGSDCMFSHEAQPSEASLSAPNELKPEYKPLPVLDNSGSKKQNNIDISSREKVDKKSCSASNAERNLVETTPKLSARPPKGISFLSSQEKLPLETCVSPKVDADVVRGSNEMTKTPPVVPRGINFLSFGKRPGLDNSNGGFSFKMGNGIGIGKSPLGDLKGDGEKNDQNTLRNEDKKVNSDSLGSRADSPQKSMPMPMLPFMSSSLQKALRSTLDFASKFDSGVKTKQARKFDSQVMKILR